MIQSHLLSLIFALFFVPYIFGEEREEAKIHLTDHITIPLQPTQEKIVRMDHREKIYRKSFDENVKKYETFIIRGKANRAGRSWMTGSWDREENTVSDGGKYNSWWENKNKLTLEFYLDDQFPQQKTDIFQIMVHINPGQYPWPFFCYVDFCFTDYHPYLRLNTFTLNPQTNAWSWNAIIKPPEIQDLSSKPDTFIWWDWFKIREGVGHKLFKKDSPEHIYEFDIRVHFGDEAFVIYVGSNRVGYSYPYKSDDAGNKYDFDVTKIRKFGVINFDELYTYHLLNSSIINTIPYVGYFPENYLKIDDAVHLWGIAKGDFEIHFYGDDDETLLKVLVQPEQNSLKLSAYVKGPNCAEKGCWGNEATVANLKDELKIDGDEGKSFEMWIKMTLQGYEFYIDSGSGEPTGPLIVDKIGEPGQNYYEHASDFQKNRPYMLWVDKDVQVINLEVVKNFPSTSPQK